YVKEIRFSFYPAETDLVTAYRRNDIDGLVLFSSAQSEELERLDVEFHPLRLPKIFAVFLNAAANPILGRISVRQALAAAIDRKVIIENTVAGSGIEVNSAIPPGSFGFAEDIPPIEYDPGAARKILADDGWKDADGDGIMEQSEGSGRQRTTRKLEILIVTSDAPELASAAELIAQMWRAIGVRTEVKTMAISDLETAMIRPRAYEALIFGEVFGHDPDPFAFWHTSQLKDPGLNIALYSNPSVDRLLEEARRTTDTESRALNYREFQRIVSREIGAIFLYSPTHTYGTRNSIKGVNIGAVTRPEERFNEINAWYIDTRRALR
ncbi:MAG: ABC transporter substrate-binding protein, partial [Patescibacteria group bacterium]